MTKNPYSARGVSATKEDVHRAIAGLPKTSYPNAFCQVLDNGDGSLSIIHADGAGTKSTIAYLHYKESGDPQSFAGIATDSSVMNIDDMLCVGACDNFLLSNTIGRNAHRIPAEVIKTIIHGYNSFCKTMAENDVHVTMCGGETADVGDLVKTVIVDSTVYAKIPRSGMIDANQIKPGHVIVGLASYGKASYETKYNSGIGSNGLTAARHLLLNKEYARKYPETYSETISPQHVYGGPYFLDDKLPGSDLTVGEALLSPTRSYAPVVKRILGRYIGKISGIVHCTGGGLTKCLNFGSGLHYVKNSLLGRPAIFDAIQEQGKISMRDMWMILNNGIRLEIYCDPTVADNIVSIAKEFSIGAAVIGEVAPNEGGKNQLTIQQGGSEELYFVA